MRLPPYPPAADCLRPNWLVESAKHWYVLAMLDRYLFGNLLRSHMALTLVLSSVVWLIQALDLFDTALSSGASVLQTMALGALVLPRVLTFTLAPALLIAVLTQIVKLLQDYEYFAFTAAGLSPFRILRPMLVLAFLVLLLQGALAFYIAPLAMKELRIRTAETGSSLALAGIQAGAFKEIKDGMTVYAGAQSGGGVWQNVMIHNRADKDAIATYTAREGMLRSEGVRHYFVLRDGTQHIANAEARGDGGDLLNFTQYVLPLNDPDAAKAKPITFNRNHMTIHQLLDPAAYGVRYEKKITRMKSRGLELISNLAAPFVFMLISFAVITSGGINRHGYGKRVMVAVALALVFQIGVISVAAQAVEKNNPGLVFVWPVLFILALLLTIFWQNDRYGVMRLFKRADA